MDILGSLRSDITYSIDSMRSTEVYVWKRPTQICNGYAANRRLTPIWHQLRRAHRQRPPTRMRAAASHSHNSPHTTNHRQCRRRCPRAAVPLITNTVLFKRSAAANNQHPHILRDIRRATCIRWVRECSWIYVIISRQQEWPSYAYKPLIYYVETSRMLLPFFSCYVPFTTYTNDLYSQCQSQRDSYFSHPTTHTLHTDRAKWFQM